MRILGIDYGRRRVGVAVSDPGCKIATPLTTLILDDIDKLIDELKTIVSEEGIGLIVMGNPVRDDGKTAELSGEIRSFAEKIKDSANVKVVLSDEYYSSARAAGKFHDAGRKIKGSKELIDRLAAADILQWYLDTINKPIGNE